MIADAIINFATSFSTWLKSNVPVKSGKLQSSIEADINTVDGGGQAIIKANSYINNIETKPFLDEQFEVQSKTAVDSRDVDEEIRKKTDEIVMNFAMKMADKMPNVSDIKFIK